MAEPVTLGGAAMLFASMIGIWIREWRKGRNQKSNGEDLKEIKKVTTAIDKNVGIIQSDVKGMKEHCRQTTQRFEKAINGNRKEILDLTKEIK